MQQKKKADFNYHGENAENYLCHKTNPKIIILKTRFLLKLHYNKQYDNVATHIAFE